jgi:hypothetical protein
MNVDARCAMRLLAGATVVLFLSRHATVASDAQRLEIRRIVGAAVLSGDDVMSREHGAASALDVRAIALDDL